MSILRHQADISGPTPLPVDRVDDASTVTAVSGETVVWYYVTSSAWAAAVGQAASTICTAKLAFTGILNSMKSAVGSFNDTSLSFAAATRAATLVTVPENVFNEIVFMSPTDQKARITPYLVTAGDYAIDHRRGQIWLKSKDTVANDSASYSYMAPVAGSGGPSDNVNIAQFGGAAVPAAIAPADAVTNTTLIGKLGAWLWGFNGTTWDRLRTAVTTISATLTGFLNTLPWGLYHTTPTVRTEGQGGPLETDADGSLRVTLKAYDATAQADKVVEQSPVNQQYTTETLVNTTNVATGTYYPSSSGLAMGGYKDLGLEGTLIDGAGETTTLTWEVSNIGGATATDWHAVYAYDWMNDTNVASVAATNETKYYALELPNVGCFAYWRCLITTSASTNTVKIAINRKAL